jgi:hypothetical protein
MAMPFRSIQQNRSVMVRSRRDVRSHGYVRPAGGTQILRRGLDYGASPAILDISSCSFFVVLRFRTVMSW